MLLRFDEEVTLARKRADLRASGSDVPMTERDRYLREFDRHKQSPNDAGALRKKYGCLKRYLEEEFNVLIPEGD